MPSSFRVNTDYAALTEIVPDLFICGISALTPTTIATHRISFIVNATSEVPNVNSRELVRIKLWIDDTPETYIYPHLEHVADQIAIALRDRHRVLVHCVAGVSRSASIVLAYLCKYHCRSLREAYHLMLSRGRPMVRPNIGFWRQLIAYELAIKNTVSVRLVRDEAQNDQLLPDVYLKLAIGERPSTTSDESSTDDRQTYRIDDESRDRQYSGSGGKLKFTPVLESICESAA